MEGNWKRRDNYELMDSQVKNQGIHAEGEGEVIILSPVAFDRPPNANKIQG